MLQQIIEDSGIEISEFSSILGETVFPIYALYSQDKNWEKQIYDFLGMHLLSPSHIDYLP